MPTESEPERLIHSYGRRRGRRLRPGQAALLRELLPLVAVAPGSDGRVDPRALFGPDIQAVWLEVGFGGGEHLAAQAAAHPEIGFIGCEPYVNGVVSLLSQMRAQGLKNVRIWQGDVRALLPALPEGALGRAFVLFPDPWPKARHHKRRLVAWPFLDALARALAPGAELRLATDDADYLARMLAHLTGHPAFRWQARGPSDWRARPADWPATRYEQKAIAGGRRPAYLRFMRVAASGTGAEPVKMLASGGRPCIVPADKSQSVG